MKYSENRENNCLCHLFDRDSGNEQKNPFGSLNIVFLGKCIFIFFAESSKFYLCLTVTDLNYSFHFKTCGCFFVLKLKLLS